MTEIRDLTDLFFLFPENTYPTKGDEPYEQDETDYDSCLHCNA